MSPKMFYMIGLDVSAAFSDRRRPLSQILPSSLSYSTTMSRCLPFDNAFMSELTVTIPEQQHDQGHIYRSPEVNWFDNEAAYRDEDNGLELAAVGSSSSTGPCDLFLEELSDFGSPVPSATNVKQEVLSDYSGECFGPTLESNFPSHTQLSSKNEHHGQDFFNNPFPPSHPNQLLPNSSNFPDPSLVYGAAPLWTNIPQNHGSELLQGPTHMPTWHLPSTAHDASNYTLDRDSMTGLVFQPRDRGVRDENLLRWKEQGFSYKEIKIKGNYAEAESTLRGRYRNLTKAKERRVRKPTWKARDIDLLRQAVHIQKSRPTSDNKRKKISWKDVAEYISSHGGSYQYGNATCKKKYEMTQAGDDSNMWTDNSEAQDSSGSS